MRCPSNTQASVPSSATSIRGSALGEAGRQAPDEHVRRLHQVIVDREDRPGDGEPTWTSPRAGTSQKSDTRVRFGQRCHTLADDTSACAGGRCVGRNRPGDGCGSGRRRDRGGRRVPARPDRVGRSPTRVRAGLASGRRSGSSEASTRSCTAPGSTTSNRWRPLRPVDGTTCWPPTWSVARSVISAALRELRATAGRVVLCAPPTRWPSPGPGSARTSLRRPPSMNWSSASSVEEPQVGWCRLVVGPTLTGMATAGIPRWPKCVSALGVGEPLRRCAAGGGRHGRSADHDAARRPATFRRSRRCSANRAPTRARSPCRFPSAGRGRDGRRRALPPSPLRRR